MRSGDFVQPPSCARRFGLRPDHETSIDQRRGQAGSCRSRDVGDPMRREGLVSFTGASSGFGAATALRFARARAPAVILGARRGGEAARGGAPLPGGRSAAAEVGRLDVRSKESIEAFLRRSWNAGDPATTTPASPSAGTPSTGLKDEGPAAGLVETNLIGLVRVTRRAPPPDDRCQARARHQPRVLRGPGVYEGGRGVRGHQALGAR